MRIDAFIKTKKIVSLLVCLFASVPICLAANVDNSLPMFGPMPLGNPQEDISIVFPKAGELLPVGAKMQPIRLEASFNQPIALKVSLLLSLDYYLAINITHHA